MGFSTWSIALGVVADRELLGEPSRRPQMQQGPKASSLGGNAESPGAVHQGNRLLRGNLSNRGCPEVPSDPPTL